MPTVPRWARMPSAAALMAGPVIAAPVYLSCPIKNDNGLIRISLDDSSNIATGQMGSLALQSFRAMFTPGKVVLVPITGSGSRWTIDRVTLQATQELYVQGLVEQWWSGQRLIEQVPPERAF